MGKNRNKSMIALIISVLMVLTLMPSMAFADNTSNADSTSAEGSETMSLKWTYSNPETSSEFGTVGYFFLDGTGTTIDDIIVESSDQSVIPSELIWVGARGNQFNVYAYPLKEGTTTLVAHSQKHPEITTSELKVTIKKRTSSVDRDVWVGKTRNLSLDKNINSYFKYKTEDESIATVDETGIVAGKSVGTTNLIVTSDKYPDFEMTWKLNVQEDPTGFYYNDEKLGDTLNWDAKDGTSIKLKVIDGTRYPKKDLSTTGLGYYDSTNKDVAEPVYYRGTVNMETAERWHQSRGEIQLKKNGTATIYVYSTDVNRTGYYVGKITLNVTGFNETSNREEGWQDVTNPQGITNLKFQLQDRKVKTQTYDMSKYDNRIVDPVKADPNFTFTLKLSKDGSIKDFESDSIRNDYTKAILEMINIYEVNDDGILGNKVASNGNGYELLKGFENNPYDPIQIKVTGKHFQKDKTYALVADAKVTASYNTKNNDNDLSNLRLYDTLATDAIWKFTVDPENPATTKKITSLSLSTTTYTYDGKAKTPSVTVKDATGKKIPANECTVKYAAGRKNVGTYSITVTLKNGAKNTLKASFRILPKKTSIKSLKKGKKSFTVKWREQKTQVTGYQVQYSTSKKFTGKSTKIKTIKGYKHNHKKITKLAKKKKYYARVRTYKVVKGKKYYSTWSKAKSVKTR